MSDGTVQQAEGQVTFRFERLFRHPAEVIWRAITNPAETEAWFGGRVEIELQPRGEFASYHRGGVRVVDRVVRLTPPTLLEHTFWEQVNPSALVTWELLPTREGCILTLTHTLSLDDVRAAAGTLGQGDDLREILSRNAAGWHHLLDMLAAILDGQTFEWSEQEQKALRARYAALV